MSIVSTYTKEEWERTGEWSGVEGWVDGVVLLWQAHEDEPISLEEASDIECGRQPPRTCAYRFYQRDDDGTWSLEATGTDHSLKRTIYYGNPTARCPHCSWIYDVIPGSPGCSQCTQRTFMNPQTPAQIQDVLDQLALDDIPAPAQSAGIRPQAKLTFTSFDVAKIILSQPHQNNDDQHYEWPCPGCTRMVQTTSQDCAASLRMSGLCMRCWIA